ncbi:MAG TPA: hypothetical protein VK817_00240 [Trebonia sp.]|jgi:hypothetical protein|nr:hypothetical protein [Trebonia sp.]
MAGHFNQLNAADGDLVLATDMRDALTEATLVFRDGATQAFTADGTTTYVENGRPTRGEWSIVKDGEFSSFWPPDYRAGYTVRWIVEGGAVTGLSFTQTASGERFDGRYE